MLPTPCSLPVEPYRRQILVEVMAWADLPPLDVGTIRNNPVPPHQVERVGLVLEDVFLELAHQRPLARRVGLPQHLLVQLDLLTVLEKFVISAVVGAGQLWLDVEQGVDEPLTVGAG